MKKALLALTAAACVAAATAPIATDRERYVFRDGPYGPEVTIVTRFTAPRDGDVFIVNCNGAMTTGLQRFEQGKWVNVWVAETNGCLSAPIVVRAGQERTETMTVISRPHQPVAPGAYRVVWHNVLTSFDRDARPFGSDLPVEHRASAPVVLE